MPADRTQNTSPAQIIGDPTGACRARQSKKEGEMQKVRPCLEQRGMVGHPVPPIMPPILISDWCAGKFRHIKPIETNDIDVVILANAGNIDPFVRMDPAGTAKVVMGDLVVEDVVGKLIRPVDESYLTRGCLGRPQACFRANRAIAFNRSGGDIEIGLKPDSTAMAPASVGIPHAPTLSRRKNGSYLFEKIPIRPAGAPLPIGNLEPAPMVARHGYRLARR